MAELIAAGFICVAFLALSAVIAGLSKI